MEELSPEEMEEIMRDCQSRLDALQDGLLVDALIATAEGRNATWFIRAWERSIRNRALVEGGRMDDGR